MTMDVTELDLNLGQLPAALTIQVQAGAGSGQLFGPACRLAGWSLRESTGAAAATVNLRTGSDASSPIIATLALAAGVSDTTQPVAEGVAAPGGVFLEVVAGSVVGAVYVTLG